MKTIKDGVETNIDTVFSRCFIVKAINGTFVVDWEPNVYTAIRQDRYISCFGSIDIVRKNAETTLNACLNVDCFIDDLGRILSNSISSDFEINGAFRQCYMELGL